jgi:hypothetical protein
MFDNLDVSGIITRGRAQCANDGDGLHADRDKR